MPSTNDAPIHPSDFGPTPAASSSAPVLGVGQGTSRAFVSHNLIYPIRCPTIGVHLRKKAAAKTFYVDFKELHPEQSESVVAWAAAYLIVGEEKSGLTLRMNSNDQGKVYLNGRELVKFTETRTLEKDAENSAKDVTLKKGLNILVLKVINEENNWQGSVRFLDKSGQPVTDFKVETKP